MISGGLKDLTPWRKFTENQGSLIQTSQNRTARHHRDGFYWDRTNQMAADWSRNGTAGRGRGGEGVLRLSEGKV